MLQGSVKDMELMQELMPTSENFDVKRDGYYEEYFRILFDDYESTKEKIKQMWDSMSDEEKQKLIEDAISNQFGSGEGNQESNEEPKDGQGSGYTEFDNSKDALKEHYNPNGTNNIEWEESELLDAQIKNLVNDKISSSKNWGKYTGNKMNEIYSANKPKISPKEILRRFNRSVQATQLYTTRMKMNRRYGLDAPGFRKEYKTKILFAIDVSGSMSDDDISNGLSVINSTCMGSELTFMTFDWDITNIEKKITKARSKFKIVGRGGTNFQPAIDYADKNTFDGVVIFTDGYAEEPTKPQKAKILWLLAKKDQNPPCSWGLVAHLNQY
jgi:predicted metal-dependent peptidase